MTVTKTKEVYKKETELFNLERQELCMLNGVFKDVLEVENNDIQTSNLSSSKNRKRQDSVKNGPPPKKVR